MKRRDFLKALSAVLPASMLIHLPQAIVGTEAVIPEVEREYGDVIHRDSIPLYAFRPSLDTPNKWEIVETVWDERDNT